MNMTITPSVRLRIDLAAGVSVGPGKIALLEQIDRSGSLSQAARVLKMSYRRAWLLLDDLNHGLGEPVTTASVGGSGGGGAQLTDFGRRVVVAYRGVEQAAGVLAAEQLAWLGPGVATARKLAAGHGGEGSRRPINRSLANRTGVKQPGGNPPVADRSAVNRPARVAPKRS